MTHLLDHLLAALALVVGAVLGVAAAVVALVSDPVMVAAISSVGACVAAGITAVFAYLGHRMARETKSVAEDTHYQVTTNGHSSETPTLPDRLADLSQEVAQVRQEVALVRSSQAETHSSQEALREWSVSHTAVGRQQIGEVRSGLARLARDVERHMTAEHPDLPDVPAPRRLP